MVFLSEENFLSWTETCRVQESVIVSEKSLKVVLKVIKKSVKKEVTFKNVESLEMEINVNGIKKLITIRCRVKK